MRWAALALALLAACKIEGDKLALVRNTCEVDTASCGDDPAVSCDLTAGLCVREEAIAPYEVALRVTPGPSQEGLLKRAPFPRFLLEGGRENYDLSVPLAVSIAGRVATEGASARLIDAEVSFIPRSTTVGQRVVVSTQRTGPAGPETNLAVSLAPDTRYGVHIQPLTVDSERLPPADTVFETTVGGAAFEYVYRAIEQIDGQLLDESGEPVVDHVIRLESPVELGARSPQVLSSTARTDQQGRFSLFAHATTLSGGSFAFAVSLDPDLPWTQAISIPASRLAGDGTLVIPVIPQRVRFLGRIEGEERASVPAELTFVSAFEIPGATGNLNDRDWCRSHVPDDVGEPFVCRARLSAFVAPDGRYATTLLPGDYAVYIVPGRMSSEGRVATRELRAVIETQPGGAPQTGQAYTLEPATVFNGWVASPRGKRMPSVSVQALALSLVGELGPVAGFNRTSSTVSDAHGNFDFAVDTGYFDLVAIPPADSGFARVYFANRVIDAMSSPEEGLLSLAPPEPVVVSGVVKGPQGPLAAAVIDAYAIVRDLSGGERAVAVGRASSDEAGVYRLNLPPEIRDEGER